MIREFCDRCGAGGCFYRLDQDVQAGSDGFVVSASTHRRDGPIVTLCSNCWAELLELALHAVRQARRVTPPTV
jgi:hypothetical protein